MCLAPGGQLIIIPGGDHPNRSVVFYGAHLIDACIVAYIQCPNKNNFALLYI